MRSLNKMNNTGVEGQTKEAKFYQDLKDFCFNDETDILFTNMLKGAM